MMNMIKLVCFLIFVMFLIGSIFADVTNDFKAAMQIFNEHKYKEAQVAIIKLMTDFPDSVQANRATTRLAVCLFHQGKYTEARVIWESLVANAKPELAIFKMGASRMIAVCFYKEKNYVEANKAAFDFMINYGREASPSYLFQMYNLLSPEFIKMEEYYSKLQDILKSVPAIETNAVFLGRIKSELEKQK